MLDMFRRPMELDEMALDAKDLRLLSELYC